MTDMVCRSTGRRAQVRATPDLTGVDDAEYLRHADDAGTDPTRARRPRLRVRLLGDAIEPMLDPRSWRIEGGRRIREVRVTHVEQVADPEGDVVLELDLDVEGDSSPYVVRVVRDRDRDVHPPEGVDPRYDRATFGFKVECAAELDCADAARDCPPDTGDAPVLDYLARDFASFRQLLFERLSLVLPAWRERHVPDVGVMLVELMAYVGDHLTYRQDVVATEAYLDTARLRISLRRHARLVDYAMHEGANARAWVTVCVADTLEVASDAIAFYTRVVGLPTFVDEDRLAKADGYQVFLPVKEALRDPARITFHKDLGRIRFYTWGGAECCLPRGATRATLILPEEAPLAPGDVLILEEVIGPKTGRDEHADPSHRQAVRLTRVERTRDPLAKQPTPLVEIEWMAEDALSFPLCLSSLNPDEGCAPVEDVSVARGNVILVDHGQRVEDDLACVVADEPPTVCEGPGRPAFAEPHARTYRPVLPRRPLTFRAPLPEWKVLGPDDRLVAIPPPASVMLRQDPRAALPDATLVSRPCEDATPSRCACCGAALDVKQAAQVCARCGTAIVWPTWTPRRDLLDSNGDEHHFVVEMDDEGEAHLRFGDGIHGMAPEPRTAFHARYRIGNGPAGNVPSEAIAHVSIRGETAASIVVRNPLPAAGGVAPEPVDDVRMLAPASLRGRRERAVIADDYAELALRAHPELQRAAAALRWTGSWYEVLVGLDPRGAEPATRLLQRTVERDLECYRRIGHDLRVDTAHYVPVLLDLFVCARPEYTRAQVRRGVLDALVGQHGFFHADRVTFGQRLVLSAIVAAVQAVPGVQDVEVRRLERLYQGDQGELGDGELPVGPLEIIRLENDPSMPEHGLIELEIGGGR